MVTEARPAGDDLHGTPPDTRRAAAAVRSPAHAARRALQQCANTVPSQLAGSASLQEQVKRQKQSGRARITRARSWQ